MELRLDMEQVSEIHREERLLSVRFTTSKPGSDTYVLFRNKTRLRGIGLYVRAVRKNLTTR